MMRLLMMALVGLVVSGPTWGADALGSYATHGRPECGEYLDAYANATLEDRSIYTGPHTAWGVFSWINGYVSAFNKYTNNRTIDILGAMTMNDARRWIGSWCRDNPTKNVEQAIRALLSKQE